MRILFVADVFGPPGREAVESRLPGLRRSSAPRSPSSTARTSQTGVASRHGSRTVSSPQGPTSSPSAITCGRETRSARTSQLRRTSSAPRTSHGAPGRGLAVVEAADGTPVAVCNLLGQLFLDVPVSPFEVLDRLVDEARQHANVVLVDFHAEATSEKIAVARMLDGRVTAVIGTHTHVQTADARIQPGGTAAITDAGMTGPHDSVIGVEADLAIQRMRTGIPVRFRPAKGGVRLEGVVLDCDPETGRATAIEPLRVELSLERLATSPRQLGHTLPLRQVQFAFMAQIVRPAAVTMRRRGGDRPVDASPWRSPRACSPRRNGSG